MKKFNYLIFAFIIALLGAAVALPSFCQTPYALSNAEVDDPTVLSVGSVAEFENIFQNDESASRSYKLTTDIDFGGAEINTSAVTFSGTFDGNGYALKNFVLSSGNQYYGLFANVNGGEGKATIKNLKLEGDDDGNFQFKIDDSSKLQLYVGILLGQGQRVDIENVEIGRPGDELNSFQNSLIISSQVGAPLPEEQADKKFSTITRFTFGGVCGELKNGSSMLKCVSYIEGRFETSLTGTHVMGGEIFAGGLVGLMENSKMQECASFARLQLYSASTDLTFFAGGMVGRLACDNVQDYIISSSVFSGQISSATNSNAGLTAAALVSSFGQVSKSNMISFNYWDGMLKAFGQDEIELDKSNKNVNSINSNFVKNATWHDRTSGWDFERVWRWETGKRLHLQKFLTFDFAFSDDLDDLILDTEKCDFEGGELQIVSGEKTTYKYKHGQPVTINIALNDDEVGYKVLLDVLRGGYDLDEKYYAKTTQPWDDATSESEYLKGFDAGYTITLEANDATAGQYSFDFETLDYSYEVKVADENLGQGSVSAGTGEGLDSFMPSQITKGASQTVEAKGKDYFTFSNWELQVFNEESGNYEACTDLSEDTKSDFNMSKFDFVFGENEDFGIKHFVSGKPFKLVAYFTDKDALNVSFKGYDKTVITQIEFNGQVYNEQPIPISPNAVDVRLFITVKEGYEFNVQHFKDVFMSRYYGGEDKDRLLSLLDIYTIDEHEGFRTYKFTKINIKNIRDNLGTGVTAFDFELHSKLMEQDDQQDLTWLWIVIGVGGGLVLLGIVLAIYLVRRNRIKKKLSDGGKTTTTQTKVKKEKTKKANYKDFYN